MIKATNKINTGSRQYTLLVNRVDLLDLLEGFGLAILWERLRLSSMLLLGLVFNAGDSNSGAATTSPASVGKSISISLSGSGMSFVRESSTWLSFWALSAAACFDRVVIKEGESTLVCVLFLFVSCKNHLQIWLLFVESLACFSSKKGLSPMLQWIYIHKEKITIQIQKGKRRHSIHEL